MLPPQSTFNWRLAIDISVSSDREFALRVGQSKAFTNNSKKSFAAKTSSSSSSKNNTNNAKKIVVIDAGHGGHDPGAIGYSGVYEKNITLSVAKELKNSLIATGNTRCF